MQDKNYTFDRASNEAIKAFSNYRDRQIKYLSRNEYI